MNLCCDLTMTKIPEIQEIWIKAKFNTHDVTLSRWAQDELVQIVKRPDSKVTLKVIVSAYVYIKDSNLLKIPFLGGQIYRIAK